MPHGPRVQCGDTPVLLLVNGTVWLCVVITMTVVLPFVTVVVGVGVGLSPGGIGIGIVGIGWIVIVRLVETNVGLSGA